jgi:hypothetical protein
MAAAQRCMQRSVAELEQKPLLRVHCTSLRRRDTKRIRIEALCACNKTAVTYTLTLSSV